MSDKPAIKNIHGLLEIIESTGRTVTEVGFKEDPNNEGVQIVSVSFVDDFEDEDLGKPYCGSTEPCESCT